jgi:SNF2 family DNA or RNA helicase
MTSVAEGTNQDYAQLDFPYKGISFNENFVSALFPHQEQTVEWMLYREQIPYDGVRGGFVFSEMGLGKTASSIATIVLAGGSTLVVVPAQLVYVWEGEINRHFVNIKYFVYHGPNRKKKFERYMLKNEGFPLIMIMSYNSVLSDIDDEGGPLRNMDFTRIIFDECHYVKNVNTETFKAVSRIKGRIKWFLSGTPIMNKIHEMYPYLKMLNYTRIRMVPQTFVRVGRFAPWGSDNEVTRNQYVQMQNLLQQIAIRRTKDILNLPKKTYNDVYITMEKVERSFYEVLRAYSEKRVRHLMKNIRRINGSALPPAVQNRLRVIILQNMLSLLFYLRIACCDPLLVIDKIPRTRNMDVVAATEELRKEVALEGKNEFDCPVCYNNVASVRNNQCGHKACKDCWKRLSRMDPMRCFTCLEETEIIYLVQEEVKDGKLMKECHDKRIFHRSSKTKNVMDLIKQELEKGHKVCVVSQWTTYLDLLMGQFKISHRDVPFVKLDGRTVPMKRQKIVDQFQDDEGIKVCFASLGSSAEGITLHAACTMIICDVYWNKAKISQVSDRIHRIGQKKDVTIHCMYMKDSIEMRLKELVDKKDAVCKIVVDCVPITRFNDTFMNRVISLLK